jgi:hypothetical protein
MPAPELTVKVPGETADTSAAAAGTTSTTQQDERLAAVLTLSKQTIAVITEALPGLVAGDLIALRDLEVAGSNRKGVLEAIEAEDARRAAIGETADAQPESLEAEVARLRAENENLQQRLQQWEDDWAAKNLAKPEAAAAVRTATTGQAYLTDAGWVVPEPQPKA